MRRKKMSNLRSLMLIGIVLSMIFGGCTTGTPLPPTATPTEEPTATPTPTATPVTAAFVDYEGEELAFRYPEDWTFSDLGTALLIVSEEELLEGSAEVYGGMVMIRTGEDTGDLEEVARLLIDQFEWEGDLQEVAAPTEISINGREGLLMSVQGTGEGDDLETYLLSAVIEAEEQQLYYLATSPAHLAPDYEAIFLAILESIVITPPPPTATPEPDTATSGELAEQVAALWSLSGQLSFAAILHARPDSEAMVEGYLQNVQTLADYLEIEIPELYEVTGESTEDEAAALNYLLNEAGPVLADYAADNFGEEGVGLVNLAVKSTLATLLYVQEEGVAVEDSTNASLYEGIESAAIKSGLPEELYAPLLEAIEEERSWDEVTGAVLTLQSEVTDYLLAQ
jgi:hypothetical protein